MTQRLNRLANLVLPVICLAFGCGQPASVHEMHPAASPGSDHLPMVELPAEHSGSAAGFAAPNPSQGFVTHFLTGRLEIHGESGATPWRLGLRTSRFGRAGSLAAVAPVDPDRTPLGVEYRHDDLVEWYLSRASGLEQGFRIASRPTGEGELVIELQSAGTLSPVAIQGGSVAFAGAVGAPVLHLDQLHVTDAADSVVPSLLAVGDGGSVEIRIADAGFEYPLLVDPMYTSAAWGDGVTGLPNGTGLGYAVAGGDLNGDGFEDVIVSSVCQSMADASCVNHVDVYVGTPFIAASGGVEYDPSWSATGDLDDEKFGWDVASADVNGDGYDDVIIGAPFHYGTCTAAGLKKGRVLVYYGAAAGAGDPTGLGANGTPANADDTLVTPSLWNAFRCTCPDDNRCSSTPGFGAALATGDINNDGIGDLVVGDPDRFSYEAYPDTRSGYGEVAVFFGSLSGLIEQDDHTARYCSFDPVECGGVRFGTRIAVGDITGDNRDDVVVTAPGDGEVYVFEGKEWGISEIDRISGSVESVAIADTDFDGFGDLVVGGNNWAEAYAGGPTGVTSSGWTYLGQTWSDGSTLVEEAFGQTATGLGDINGDCYEDVAIGAPRWPGPVPLDDEAAGRVYVFQGSSTGLEATPVDDFNGAWMPQAMYGWDLEPFSLDGGREQDLLTGTPFANFQRGQVAANRGYGSPVTTMSPDPLQQVDQDGNPWQVELLLPYAGSTTSLKFRVTALADFSNGSSAANAIAFDADVLSVDAPAHPTWVVEHHPNPSFANYVLISYTDYFLNPPNNGDFIEFTLNLEVEPEQVTAYAASGSVTPQTATFSGGPIADCDGDGTPRELDCDDARANIEPGAVEICDGLDNDCDRVYDEGYGVGDSCSVGTGACQSFGWVECDAGGGSSSCNAIPGTGSPEACDLIDNDCDGLTDEVQDLGQTTCGLGACDHTVDNCVSGVIQVCDPLEGATGETCNGIDDDCEGTVDDGIADIITGSDVGECQTQIESCIGGSFQITQAEILPAAEICDGLDNDCDGQDDVTQGICNSPPGGDATVTDPASEASVTLPGVTVGGDTTITQINCSDLAGVAGIAINGASPTCIDVDTTAEWAGGEAVVCMTYEDDGTCSVSTTTPCTSDASCPTGETCNDPAEDDLTMVRFPDTGPPPVELTFVSQDFVNNVYCASTPTFSGFAVGVLLDNDGDFTVDIRDNCPLDFNFFQDDQDGDERGDVCDNCYAAPNAPVLGTCTAGDAATLGRTCADDVGCGAGGTCSLNQDNWDWDNVGDACDPRLVHFFTPDVFATPPCYGQGGCNPSDFPYDWGVVQSFHYGVPASASVEDVRIHGTWGGDVFGGSAPAQVFVEGVLVAECLEFDPCWNNASTVDWNGGAGVLLSDLGVDFTDPTTQALFADGVADLSVVQNGEISANFSALEMTVYVPEPNQLLALAAGVLLLGALRHRRRTHRAAWGSLR